MDRKTIVESLTKNLSGIFVEIGTDKGEFADFLLSNTKCEKLYCIDPYIKYSEYFDTINQYTNTELFLYVRNKLKIKHNKRFELIRDFSNNASRYLPDNIDFLYIDGNHSYKYVLEDLQYWYPKVKNGGIIMGDDVIDIVNDDERNTDGNIYKKWSECCDGYYGVYKALIDFCLENDIEYIIQGTQFIIIK